MASQGLDCFMTIIFRVSGDGWSGCVLNALVGFNYDAAGQGFLLHFVGRTLGSFSAALGGPCCLELGLNQLTSVRA